MESRTLLRADRRRHRQSVGEDDGKRGVKGFDAGKKIKGRKRHIAVDTLGLLLVVLVTSAGLQDDHKQAVGELLMRLWHRGSSRLKTIFADGSYEGSAVMWATIIGGWMMQIVRRLIGDGFHVLPKRWVVERTFAWLGRYRRLSKDYEQKVHSSETMIYLAMISLMLRRLSPRSRTS
jgi:putative transposase